MDEGCAQRCAHIAAALALVGRLLGDAMHVHAGRGTVVHRIDNAESHDAAVEALADMLVEMRDHAAGGLAGHLRRA